jgi:hypothetical protein
VETNWSSQTPTGAVMVVMNKSGIAVRQSTIFALAKATAPEIAVNPLSHKDQGMMTFFNSKPNNPNTGVAMNATPKPIIPAMNERTNNNKDMMMYNNINLHE